MKNKTVVLLIVFVMVILSGFSFVNPACAESCQVDVQCINCLNHKHNCCKGCCCKDCKLCYNKDKNTDQTQKDCCIKAKPVN